MSMKRLVGLIFFNMSAALAQNEPPVVGFKEALEIFLKTPIYQSFEKDLESIQLEYEASDVVLQPILELRGARTREDRELLFTSAATRPRSDLWNLSVTKPFSTGTWLQVNSSWESAITPTLSPNERDLVEWQVVLSQSLWKDSFGKATRLRWDREAFEKRQRLADTLRQRAQALVEFENLYWDWALTLKEAELQQKNLKRSREILRWVQDRFNRAAAERTDYLNAKALLARRELQVSSIQQRITQSLTLIERYVPNGLFRPDPNDLSYSRNPEALLSKWVDSAVGDAVPLQYLSLSNEAEAERIRAKEVRDSIRPELNLEASYGKNAIDPSTSDAFRRASSENNELSSVGVVYRTGLDIFKERKLARSADQKSKALLERKEAYDSEAKVAWAKLNQELSEIQQQIDRAHELLDIQMQKSNAERDRYRKGRTTAFEAITYEQEVAESEIILWGLHALKRKTEARARLYAR